MNVSAILAAFCVGCAAAMGPAASPECSPQGAAMIEAAFIAEATQACERYNYDTCPSLPAIREKYEQKRTEFILCGRR